MDDYCLAANYKLLPVTFFWVDQPLLQTKTCLCSTEENSPVGCTGSHLLKMYLWAPYLRPWGLLVQLKPEKICLNPNLAGNFQLTLPGWCLPVHFSLTNSFVPKHLPRQNPPNPQNLTASTQPQSLSAFNWVKVFSLVRPQNVCLQSSHP